MNNWTEKMSPKEIWNWLFFLQETNCFGQYLSFLHYWITIRKLVIVFTWRQKRFIYGIIAIAEKEFPQNLGTSYKIILKSDMKKIYSIFYTSKGFLVRYLTINKQFSLKTKSYVKSSDSSFIWTQNCLG